MSIVTPQRLAGIPLFSQMGDEERAELRSIMTERVSQPGEVVMNASDSRAVFFIIEKGEVEIWLTDSDGNKVVLDNLGPGEFFGELSMLAEEDRSASVTADGQLVTVELDRAEFFDFLRRRPDAAINVLLELGQRLKRADSILRTRVSRNPNEEQEEHISVGQRIADLIADFSGSIAFLLVNLAVFVVWIVVNTVGAGLLHFDPYPFQFLTMAVSLEAIFLSIFVLISQNRQAAKDRIKADLDYQVDVKAEMEMGGMAAQIREIQRKIHDMHGDILEIKEQKEQQPSQP
ncbi:MAG: DUF1003 domain-containing protein [Ktedonobacteraceae bacterium]|nr:DUF1003 domain-containing protein [Ktedonobacteraceae bacterium]